MATKVHIVVEQGTSFSTELSMLDQVGDPIDLTGYTAAAQLRKWYTSTNAVSFGTVINIASSTLTLTLTANQTANIVGGKYVYDVELTDQSGIVSRIVEGYVTVTPQVTR